MKINLLHKSLPAADYRLPTVFYAGMTNTLLRCAVILSFKTMQLIAAALEEELKTALDLCRKPQKIHCRGIHLWQAVRGDRCFQFLKTGVGPKRAASSLEEALRVTTPSHILLIGYAGALDPKLKLGNLVMVCKAIAFRLDERRPDWEHFRLDGTFELTNFEALAELARHLGLIACTGHALTSSYVLGSPAHKRILHEQFQASIVDMETAALADIADHWAIPFSCVRSISDEAQDNFLEPFSHNPSTGFSVRAQKLLDTGMMKTYREWRNHASVARESLSRFLSYYL